MKVSITRQYIDDIEQNNENTQQKKQRQREAKKTKKTKICVGNAIEKYLQARNGINRESTLHRIARERRRTRIRVRHFQLERVVKLRATRKTRKKNQRSQREKSRKKDSHRIIRIASYFRGTTGFRQMKRTQKREQSKKVVSFKRNNEIEKISFSEQESRARVANKPKKEITYQRKENFAQS